MIPAFLLEYGFEDRRTDLDAAELAIIIGKRCRNVSADEAFDHVMGYTCINDVSQRNIQTATFPMVSGKSLDTFGPVGPQIVLHEQIGNPQNLRIQCRLNGVTVQDASTSQMIFPVTDI